MRGLGRIGVPLVGAAVITFSLFFLMQLLITNSLEKPIQNSPEFEVTVLKFQQIPPIPTPDRILRPKNSQTPGMPLFKSDLSPEPGVGVTFEFNVEVADKIEFVGLLENNAVTAVFIPIPQYPYRALNNSIEGYAVVEFTVGEDGRVYDVRIVSETPTGFGFGRTALKAAERFRFNPRIIEGVKVATHGVGHVFHFYMIDE